VAKSRAWAIDGLLVYFGYPLAHEDDAQRAVRAGLAMVEAVGQLNTRLAPERGVHLAGLCRTMSCGDHVKRVAPLRELMRRPRRSMVGLRWGMRLQPHRSSAVS
jgi:class 3 adenylate cyclase